MISDFPGRQADEKILMVIQKHPIVYIRSFLIFLVAAMLPLTIFLMIWSNRFPLSEGGTAGIIGYLGSSLYFLYSLALLLISWLDDEFDLFILTNHRLIDITQVSFLKRTVATTPLDQIQDASSDIHGVLATLLNFGSIDVQTAAGLASNFSIANVPDPAMVARTILNHVEQIKEQEHSM